MQFHVLGHSPIIQIKAHEHPVIIQKDKAENNSWPLGCDQGTVNKLLLQ